MIRSEILNGAAAGLAASVIQAAVGTTEEMLLLPPGEDANLAPRLVDRLAERVGWEPSDASKWAMGTAFHLGYGAVWGGLYAAVHRRHPVPPMLGGVNYGITFPRWGGAVRTGTERPPEARTDQMALVAVCVTAGFGLATALLYDQRTAPDRVA